MKNIKAVAGPHGSTTNGTGVVSASIYSRGSSTAVNPYTDGQLYHIGDHQIDADEFRRLLESLVETQPKLSDFEQDHARAETPDALPDVPPTDETRRSSLRFQAETNLQVCQALYQNLLESPVMAEPSAAILVQLVCVQISTLELIIAGLT